MIRRRNPKIESTSDDGIKIKKSYYIYKEESEKETEEEEEEQDEYGTVSLTD